MVQKDAEQESEMRAEIQEMKKEQSSISMMDEFARYARLGRKINKMTDKLKTHGEPQEKGQALHWRWTVPKQKLRSFCITWLMLFMSTIPYISSLLPLHSCQRWAVKKRGNFSGVAAGMLRSQHPCPHLALHHKLITRM